MKIVKIIIDDSGEKVKYPKWHLSTNVWDAERTLCSGEVFGEGESSAIYKEQIVTDLKKMTCPNCREILKYFKAIKP